MPMWTDGSVSYYRFTKSGEGCQALEACGYMAKLQKNSKNYKDDLSSKVYIRKDKSCRDPMKANVLCEVPASKTSQPVVLPTPPPWTQLQDFARCPSGHYTHQFLACDVRTGCWALDYSSCDVDLTLPFACNNEFERVPYTLVCDHRADCNDESDEDFCVFSPCDSTQYSCDSKQVISPQYDYGDCRHRSIVCLIIVTIVVIVNIINIILLMSSSISSSSFNVM